MWCVDREGSHGVKFPEKIGNSIALMDGSEDYLKYKGDCSSAACPTRYDDNDNKCTDKKKNDKNPWWHFYKCV